MHIRFWWDNLREESYLEDPSAGRRIILKWTFTEWNGGMDWIDMDQDRDRWRALITTAMHLRFP